MQCVLHRSCHEATTDENSLRLFNRVKRRETQTCVLQRSGHEAPNARSNLQLLDVVRGGGGLSMRAHLISACRHSGGECLPPRPPTSQD